MGKQDKKKEKRVGKYRIGDSNKLASFISQFTFAISDTSNAAIDVEKHFSQLLSENKSLSAGIAAIKTLLMVLEKTKCLSAIELHSLRPIFIVLTLFAFQLTPCKSYTQQSKRP